MYINERVSGREISLNGLKSHISAQTWVRLKLWTKKLGVFSYKMKKKNNN